MTFIPKYLTYPRITGYEHTWDAIKILECWKSLQVLFVHRFEDLVHFLICIPHKQG